MADAQAEAHAAVRTTSEPDRTSPDRTLRYHPVDATDGATPLMPRVPGRPLFADAAAAAYAVPAFNVSNLETTQGVLAERSILYPFYLCSAFMIVALLVGLAIGRDRLRLGPGGVARAPVPTPLEEPAI